MTLLALLTLLAALALLAAHYAETRTLRRVLEGLAEAGERRAEVEGRRLAYRHADRQHEREEEAILRGKRHTEIAGLLGDVKELLEAGRPTMQASAPPAPLVPSLPPPPAAVPPSPHEEGDSGEWLGDRLSDEERTEVASRSAMALPVVPPMPSVEAVTGKPPCRACAGRGVVATSNGRRVLSHSTTTPSTPSASRSARRWPAVQARAWLCASTAPGPSASSRSSAASAARNGDGSRVPSASNSAAMPLR